MSKQLDCENKETTINSLCSLFEASRDALLASLNGINIDEIYKDYRTSPAVPPETFLFRHLCSLLGEPEMPSAVCWFHLTRCLPGNDFKEGIQPLGQIIDRIWETLFIIFRSSEIKNNLHKMRANGFDNYHYKLKAPDPFHWGPYAMLVKDAAFNPKEMINHDYLWLPEIIEDICNGYLDKYDISIHDEVVCALTPCIVKFKSNYRIDEGCFEAAIVYLYLAIRGKKPSSNANTCFDGEGHPVPSSCIISVEYLRSQ